MSQRLAQQLRYHDQLSPRSCSMDARPAWVLHYSTSATGVEGATRRHDSFEEWPCSHDSTQPFKYILYEAVP